MLYSSCHSYAVPEKYNTLQQYYIFNLYLLDCLAIISLILEHLVFDEWAIYCRNHSFQLL
jgi:hypothetical protein